MKKLFLLLLFGLLGLLLCPLTGLRAEATAKPEGQGKAIVMENEFMRLVIDPDRGGMIVSLVHKGKGTKRDMVPRDKKYMGLFMDHLWGQGWPGELLESPYEAAIVKPGPGEAVVKTWRTVKGDWQGLQQKIIQGLVIEKTFTLKDGSDALLCHVAVKNPTAEARLPAYWSQNVFFIGGDYDATKDVFFRPSTRGVKLSWQGGRVEDFVRDPVLGWSAAADTAKGDGLVFLMNYDDLEMLYDCGGNSTLEWMYDKIPVPAGRAWETDITLIPTAGVSYFAHASHTFLAGLDMKRKGDTFTLTHRLRASAESIEGLTLDVKVIGASDRKETAAAPLAVGALDTQWKSVPQELKAPSPDPLIVLATATGRCGGKEFNENYFVFFAGSYGFGENVQQDLQTPLYKIARPEKKQELMRPDQIARVREARPQIFTIKGMFADAWQLGEAMKRINAEGRLGAYSIGQEGPRTTDFPFDYDTLMKQDVVVVANANLECLGRLGLMILRDYLTHGGSLLLLGGKSAYGSGGLNGSCLADLLPVRADDSRFDIQTAAAVPIRVEKKHPAIQGLEWGRLPAAPLYVHRAKPRNNGEVLLSAGGHPLLVVGETQGGGRIACLLATPYGGEGEKLPAFLAAKEWPEVMKNLLAWLSQRTTKR